MLRSLERFLITDVSGQPVGPGKQALYGQSYLLYILLPSLKGQSKTLCLLRRTTKKNEKPGGYFNYSRRFRNLLAGILVS